MSDDNHTFDPSGSGSTYNTPKESTTNPGKAAVFSKKVQVRKWLKKYKTKQSVILKVREELDMTKVQAMKIVDQVMKDMFSYEEYDKKSVREVLVRDIDDQMVRLEELMEQIKEDMELATGRELSSLRYQLNEYKKTYLGFQERLHKFYKPAIDLENAEDQRDTSITIEQVVIQAPQRDLE